MTASTSASPDRLAMRSKLLFSTGDLSTSIPLALVMFFQLYFLTDVAGLPPNYAAWAVGAGRIWDAIEHHKFDEAIEKEERRRQLPQGCKTKRKPS